MIAWTPRIAIVLALVSSWPACAQGPFDGAWKGRFETSHGRGCGNGELAVRISNTKVRGQITFSNGEVYPIGGTIDADGNFVSKKGNMKGKFGGTGFTVQWTGLSAECEWEGSGTRSVKPRG